MPKRPLPTDLLATGLLAAAALPAASPALAQAPSADEVLRELGFDEAARKKALAGEFVEVNAKPSTDREISVSMAFLVDTPPQTFVAELETGLLLQADPDAKAHGVIEGEPTVEKLAALSLSADEAKTWLQAEPGGDVNLSAQEHATLAALRKKGASPAEVEAAVRRILVDRLVAYQQKGLDGIAPHALADGKTRDAAGELRQATQALVAARKWAPDFFQVLTRYPAAKPDWSIFRWMSYTAHGSPVLILTHGFMVNVGDAVGAAQRQFYVSGSYNVEQATAGFFPVQQGTLVAYTNRTSTDQVEGFGGSGKRAIGRKLMASQLQALFQKVRAEAAK